MYKKSLPTIQNINDFIDNHESKKLVRFLTCGSVDDGKSTLIGRLLYDSQSLNEDQIKLKKNSLDELDLAALLDGLQSEKEQGITIDVAYKYFSTQRSKFILADTPGHEEFTRNMVTGASNCDMALLLVDSQKGVIEQTKRHALITSLLGIQEIVVVINKMDLVNYSQDVFEKIKESFQNSFASISFSKVHFIPVSALLGDNVFHQSKSMDWYKGENLITILEAFKRLETSKKPFIFSVQYINQTKEGQRLYCGNILAGAKKSLSTLKILPSLQSAHLKTEVELPLVNKSFQMEIIEERDISRGSLLIEDKKTSNIHLEDRFEADLVWMSSTPLSVGVPFFLKIHNKLTTCRVEEILYKYDLNTLEEVQVQSLKLNDVSRVIISLNEKVAFTTYEYLKNLGSFVMIERFNHNTVSAGMIRRKVESRNIKWHKHLTSSTKRSAIKNHKGAVLWFTGLSGSGKSSIANALEAQLNIFDVHTYLLDGDNIRLGLCKDLSFTPTDRKRNITRVAEVSKLFLDAGLIVISSFISPYEESRSYAKKIMPSSQFIEIFINTSIETCKERDPKGLYQKALKGEIKSFTGISAPYEAPISPDIEIQTEETTIEEAVDIIIKFLKNRKIIL